MTDRELLELAAKAHGGLVYVDDMGWIHEDADGNRGSWWNPLADDGDALRLAVRLGLNVSCDTVEYNETTVIFDGGRLLTYEPHKKANPLAATRRAIVRAAAEIGRTK